MEVLVTVLRGLVTVTRPLVEFLHPLNVLHRSLLARRDGPLERTPAEAGHASRAGTMNAMRVAIVGATGAVGRTMLGILRSATSRLTS